MEWRKVNPKGVCGGVGVGERADLAKSSPFLMQKESKRTRKKRRSARGALQRGRPGRRTAARRGGLRCPTLRVGAAPLCHGRVGPRGCVTCGHRSAGRRGVGWGGGGCEGSGAAWAGQRFTSAGLSSPLVLSLSFFGTRDVREADPSKKCHFNDFNKQNRKQF